jgi:hypothetical protein
MNSLIDFYKNMSADPVLFSRYTSASIGREGWGCMFSPLINTNYRAILAPAKRNQYGYGGFAQGFSVLEEVEGQVRNEWLSNRANNAGQEVEKQHTVHLRKAVFFQVRDRAYYKTQRGKVFQRMLTDNSLSSVEKRLLCYLLILPASFDETKNFLFDKTRTVFTVLKEQGVSSDVVLNSIKEVIAWNNTTKKTKKEELFNYDFVYYDSFFVNNVGFLPLFVHSPAAERKEFKNYIVESIRNLKKSDAPRHHILSKKYANGGAYTRSSLIEDAWLLYVTNALLNADNMASFERFVKVVLTAYGELFKIDESELRRFIFNPNGNRSVFQIVFCELFDIPIPIKDVAKDLTPEEIEKYGMIDPTDTEGYAQREIVISSLKKLAKQRANHKCECEDVEGCRYFTSKESGQTYLEIHHFIPREFANDFDTSIEILGNYVALCPNCHRKIHSAVDGERKHLITLLFKKRETELPKRTLTPTLDLSGMFEYYKVTD